MPASTPLLTFQSESSFLFSCSKAFLPLTHRSFHVLYALTIQLLLIVVYLCDISNTDGQALLKRLKYAFLHGLTFNVGTSITTGAKNQCTWASVHHKTSPSGGVQAHGFPDPDYFNNCNAELDVLGVPSTHSLDENGKEV